jgi:hypothetical protein
MKVQDVAAFKSNRKGAMIDVRATDEAEIVKLFEKAQTDHHRGNGRGKKR